MMCGFKMFGNKRVGIVSFLHTHTHTHTPINADRKNNLNNRKATNVNLWSFFI